MRISKRSLLVAFALVLTCLAVWSSFVPRAEACWAYGVTRYYSSSSYSVQVGQRTVTCNCVITTTGTVTSYSKFTAYNCGIEP